jgi:EmrB/QacA subfamily drug resistance transporter
LALAVDGQAREGDPRRWWILGVLCLALLVVGIDGTIVNVALPTFVTELHASASELQWVVDAYTIVFASFLLIAGNSGDRLGRKPCFLAGLVVFVGGSLGCALVHTPSHLILLRGVQGLGAAFIMPATLSILTNAFPDEFERARAIALWAGVSGLGVAIGPLAGGFLLEHFWWGSIFLVNLPIVALALVGVVAIVPNSRDEAAGKLDLLGTVLSTAGLIALLYGIIEGPGAGWGSPHIVASFVAGAVLLSGFVFWERSTDHPILDVRFFANARFSAASVAVTLVFFAMFGALFFVSQYLQFVLGYSALQCGVRLLPVAVVLMIAAPLSAKLVARWGTKIVVAAGLGLVAAALLLYTQVTAHSGYGLIAAILVVVGAGMGLAMAPATDSIMGALPPEKAGVGSATNDTTREIGGALGVAILGTITHAGYTAHLTAHPQFAQLETAAPQAAAVVKSSVGGAAIVASKLPADLATTLQRFANEAFVAGTHRAVILGAVVAALGALVAALFLPARAERRAGDVDELVEGAAMRLSEHPDRRSLADATLGLLAEAGMSSLTYHGVATRAGYSTATLERLWTSRVDAVTDALHEVYEERPVPDTGDLRADLCDYVGGLAALLSAPEARRVLGAVVAEAARHDELATALRERVLGPRRAELTARLVTDHASLLVPVDAAVDQLLGPIFYRVLFFDAPIDRQLVDAVVTSVAGAESGDEDHAEDRNTGGAGAAGG